MSDPLDQLMTTFYQAFAGDTALLQTVVTADWEDIPLAPGQGPGPLGAIPIIEALASSISNLEIVVHDIVDGRDANSNGMIATRCELRGVHTAELMGAPPSAKHVTMAIHEFHQVAEGHIRRTWHLEDWFGFLRQVGHAPTRDA